MTGQVYSITSRNRLTMDEQFAFSIHREGLNRGIINYCNHNGNPKIILSADNTFIRIKYRFICGIPINRFFCCEMT